MKVAHGKSNKNFAYIRAYSYYDNQTLNGPKVTKFLPNGIKLLGNISTLSALLSSTGYNLSHFHHHFKNEDIA